MRALSPSVFEPYRFLLANGLFPAWKKLGGRDTLACAGIHDLPRVPICTREELAAQPQAILSTAPPK